MASPRAPICWTLAALGALCLVAANLSIWAHQVVYDRAEFRDTAHAAFDDERVRREIALRAVDRLLPPESDIRPGVRKQLAARLAKGLGHERVRPAIGAALELSWLVFVDRDPRPVVLDVTGLKGRAVAFFNARDWPGTPKTHDPELAARLRALPEPVELEILSGNELPSLAPYRSTVRTMVWGFLALAVLLLAAGMWLDPDRSRALRRLGWLIAAPAALLAVLALLLPGSKADQGVLVEVGLRVVTTRLLWQCAGLILLGALVYGLGTLGRSAATDSPGSH